MKNNFIDNLTESLFSFNLTSEIIDNINYMIFDFRLSIIPPEEIIDIYNVINEL